MALRRCSNLHTGEEENGKRMRNNDECDGANSCCRQMYLLPPFKKKKKNSSFAVPALPFVSTKRRLHCLHHFLFSTHALFEVATHTTRNLSCCASRPVFSFCTHGKSAAYKEESDGRKPTTRPLKKKKWKDKTGSSLQTCSDTNGQRMRHAFLRTSTAAPNYFILFSLFFFSSFCHYRSFFFFWFA